MATKNQIFGDYYVNTVPVGGSVYSGNIHFATDTVKVYGNLDVLGNLTYINVQELNIKDPFIMLNASNTGSYSSNSGVLTHTAATTFAGIRFDSSANVWELNYGDTDSTGLTGTWSPISSGGAIGGANTDVQFNDNGLFGGTNNFTFDKNSNKVTIKGQMVLGNINSTPGATSNAVSLYNKAEGAGGTGVYVRTSSTTDELVSKRRAIAFGLIF